MKSNYIAADIITSGYDVEHSQIVGLNALKIENGEIVDSFSSFCKPEKPLSKDEEMTTGIAYSSLIDKPSSTELLPSYLSFIGSSPLVVDNDRFYLRCLNKIMGKASLPPIENEIIDVTGLVEKRSGFAEIYGVLDAADALGMSGTDDDLLCCEMIYRVYEKLKSIEKAL